jgi:hypothetical protein
MDVRLTNELLKYDETKKYGLLLDAASRDVSYLKSQLDFFEGPGKQDIESAILTTTGALSSLSLNAGVLLADITGKSAFEAVGKVVADVIRALGAIGQTVAAITSGSFSDGGYGSIHKRNVMTMTSARVSLTAERNAMNDAANRILIAGAVNTPIGYGTWTLPLKSRCFVLKQVDRFQIAKTADLQRDISGAASLSITGASALTVLNPTLLPALLTVQLAAVIDRHADGNEWIDMRSASVEGDSLETATKICHEFSSHLALPVRAGTMAGAFTNFNDLTLITGALNSRIVGRMEAVLVNRPVVNSVQLDQRTVAPLKFIEGDIFRHTVHAVNALSHDALKLASSIAKIRSGGVLTTAGKINDVTESAMTFTNDALLLGAQIYQEYVTRHTVFDTPDYAVECVEDNDREVIQYLYHGHKTKSGLISGRYDGTDLTGYITPSSHGHTPPVDLPPAALVSLKDNASFIGRTWNWVKSMATSSTQEDLMLRSKVYVGSKNDDSTSLIDVTGGFEYEASWTVTTSAPELVPGLGYTRDVNGLHTLTAGMDIYWTNYNSEYFILAYYNGMNWVINDTPTVAI